MYYNLKTFGNKIRSIRKKLGLTQKDVYELSSIHVDTLRKIENYKVIPTQETLDSLSIVLKKDLNQLLLSCRLNNYSDFEEIRNRLESKIDRDEYQTLSIELEDLKTLLNNNSHPYFTNHIKQLILLIESIILNKKHNKPKESLNKLIEAMKVTTTNFSLDNYKSFVYNSVELRILMNIALLVNKIDSTENSLEIMEFCINMVEPDSSIYPKLYYNLAYTYHRLDIHDKALKYSDLGIEYCMQYRNYNGINLLYFRKGIAEYLLGYETFMDSIEKCIYFCEILDQNELKDLFINNCKKFYNIELQL